MRIASLFGQKKPTIFVQIASYRDPECQWTVNDLFAQATFPERVHVGICWQYDKQADSDCFTVPSPYPRQTRILHVKASDSKGVCWARHQTQTLYNNEDYVLMIDSHMRFEKGWDEILIHELSRCSSRKPLLTHYPPGYEPPRQLAANPLLSVMTAKPFDALGDIRGDGIALEVVPETPLRGAFIAAGFIFAKASLIIEVPHDPYMYFNQEEMSLAARMYTHGWDVYHPTRIVVYHYYKKPGDPTKRTLLHWENDANWRGIAERSRQRFWHLLAGTKSQDPEATAEIDHYGLGKKRSLAQFETFAGIDFTNRTVSERALKATFIPELERYKHAPIQAKAASHTTPDKRALTPLSPLNVGQLMPPFLLNDSDDRPVEIQLYAGKPLALFFLPLDFPEFVASFFAYYDTRREAITQTATQVLFVVQGNAQEAAALRTKFAPSARFICDPQGALYRTCGIKNPRIDAMSTLLSPAQRILATFDDRNAINQLADTIRAMQSQASQPNTPTLATQAHPPVLIVPDALSHSMRAELLDYWRRGSQYDGTIGVDGNEKVISTGKRRRDVDLRDRALLVRVDDQIAKTVLPELRKVSAFEALYRERYKVGCYRAEDAGHYSPHRDTGVKQLAYRRYSMSLALSQEYDGGLLYFPEYAAVHYKIPAGSAVLFPSALLHGVTPVKRGERFVLVSFFHGPLEEAYRKRQLLDSGKAYDEGEVRMLVESRYEGLPQSQHLYTSSIITRVIDDV